MEKNRKQGFIRAMFSGLIGLILGKDLMKKSHAPQISRPDISKIFKQPQGRIKYTKGGEFGNGMTSRKPHRMDMSYNTDDRKEKRRIRNIMRKLNDTAMNVPDDFRVKVDQ